jgi:hypothetical protein
MVRTAPKAVTSANVIAMMTLHLRAAFTDPD